MHQGMICKACHFQNVTPISMQNYSSQPLLIHCTTPVPTMCHYRSNCSKSACYQIDIIRKCSFTSNPGYLHIRQVWWMSVRMQSFKSRHTCDGHNSEQRISMWTDTGVGYSLLESVYNLMSHGNKKWKTRSKRAPCALFPLYSAGNAGTAKAT